MNNSLQVILQKHHRQVKKKLARHEKAKEWLAKKGLSVANLRERSAKLLTAGALAGTLLLNPGTADLPKFTSGLAKNVFVQPLAGEELKKTFSQTLLSILPQEPAPLKGETEADLAELFKKYLKINAVGMLEGNHLNTTYGYTGEEQHLARFPGDSITQHDELQEVGMAPGRGAWGYISDPQMEKYYIAVQTLYLPDWNTKQPYLKDWYKFRKVLVVNPKNGQAAVAVIGDAGPANWTGKQFGCSPELMHYLDLDKGMKKGEIIVFFVDEAQSRVKLGPIEYDKIRG